MFGLSKELSAVLLFFAWLPLHQGWAQPVSCYQVVKVKGQEAFNRQNYPEAIRNWTSGKRCADAVSKSPIAKLEADMVRISGGTFTMGCTSEQKDCDSDESPTTRVTVSDFYLGKFELALREFKQFIDASGYKTDADKDGGSYLWTGSKWEKKSGVNWKCDVAGKIRPSSEYEHPVIHVSWNDAIAYCNWRSEKEGLSKVYTISRDKVRANWNANGYRLPTEAEWEYAARDGGKAIQYAWGNGKPNGNVADETAKKKFADWTTFDGYTDGHVYTSPVGTFAQGSLGLHDMSGNVWEWCWDWYDIGYYAKSNNNRDPRGPDSGSDRVGRGGSWDNFPAFARVANRLYNSPDNRYDFLGFRLARTVE